MDGWAWIWFLAFVASLAWMWRRSRWRPLEQQAAYLEGKRDGYHQRAGEEADLRALEKGRARPPRILGFGGGRRRNWMDGLN